MEKQYVDYKQDPEGFFHIYLDDTRRNIIVEHYNNVERVVDGREQTVSGRMNRLFKGSSAQTLYRTILSCVPLTMGDHIAYLGYELGKAESALKNNVRYEQDKPLKL
jgi:dihydropteroate synthase